MRHTRIPLGRADLLAAAAMHEARQSGLPFASLIAVGGLRRFAPSVRGAVLLGIAAEADHARAVDGFASLPFVRSILAHTPANVRVMTDRGMLDLHLSTPDDAGASLLWATGSHRHIAWLATRAAERGLSFVDGRLTDRGGSRVTVHEEAAVYELLDLPFVPPELREGGDEFDAAVERRLPRLVTARDIRGDLHMHTTWSDGRDTIFQMVLAAQTLGYEYVAITDHSERSLASRKLLAMEVALQREEIATVREQMPGIAILHGVEVDIMADGSLDFDDETLAGFDIVLASLHDAHGHDGARLTDRYLRAIRHPLVNVITHPANRSPALFDGYALDYDRLFDAAVETGTAMEIDGAPGHLDMDGHTARRAVAAGVTLTIDSDCHRAELLERQMHFGVGTARRGWVEPHHVLNTRSVADVRAFVARKRRQGGPKSEV